MVVEQPSQLSEEIRREIGQHFVFGFHGHEVTSDIEVLIRDYYLGNVILMKRNVKSAQQVHQIIQRLQQIAREAGHERPLMIGIDQENGLVSAFSSASSDDAGTQFPGAMALAATDSLELTGRVSAASAQELKLVGINWAYSPVADVNSDSRNPVIGVRSFSDDPHRVAAYASAVARGLTSSGVAPSAKHFPGHGDTHTDSHIALPIIPKPPAALTSTELVPFAALAASCATIMTGHMALPRVTGDMTPASLAPAATHGLLRDAMGYEGVIVTDCLEMEAVAAREGGVPVAAVDAICAGADIVMICHRFERHIGAVRAVYDAVSCGRIDLDAVRISGRRIATLKDKFAGTWMEAAETAFDYTSWQIAKAASRALSAKAYAMSIALLQNPNKAIPLHTDGSVMVFTPRTESINLAIDDADGLLRTSDGKLRNTAGPSYITFAADVTARTSPATLHVVYGPGESLAPADQERLRGARSVLFVTRNADRSVWQRDYLRYVLGLRGGPSGVVLLASCAPYDLLDVPPGDALLGVAYVTSFEFTVPALKAANAVVFGEVQAEGKVPVCKGAVVGARVC
ncbi:glycoside hydrolase family 3 protein [Auriscalpium vulgare]|uniref:Glycoside hydrolase family 3 protein n=1 Tax=Auriscalpium vulgare TaxID=40419 RepID=A0ACB8R7H1_9AGAM|nr:glycoside hydrolase family 3 protein [Auriscalpium vulgare]